MKAKIKVVICLLLMSLLIIPSDLSYARYSTKIKLNSKKVNLTVGNKTKVTVLSRTKVKWKTSNKKVASVSSKGVIKAIKPGKAVVTAYNKIYKVTCKVTVRKKPVYDNSGNSIIPPAKKTAAPVAKATDTPTKRPSSKPFATPKHTPKPTPTRTPNATPRSTKTPRPTVTTAPHETESPGPYEEGTPGPAATIEPEPVEPPGPTEETGTAGETDYVPRGMMIESYESWTPEQLTEFLVGCGMREVESVSFSDSEVSGEGEIFRYKVLFYIETEETVPDAAAILMQKPGIKFVGRWQMPPPE